MMERSWEGRRGRLSLHSDGPLNASLKDVDVILSAMVNH